MLTGLDCLFGARCSEMMGHVGLDEHHPWPLFMGGPAHQVMARLCPNHHRRQHSLIRGLVTWGEIPWSIGKYFWSPERAMAAHAVDRWRQAGEKPLPAWNVELPNA